MCPRYPNVHQKRREKWDFDPIGAMVFDRCRGLGLWHKDHPYVVISNPIVRWRGPVVGGLTKWPGVRIGLAP